MKKCPPKYQKEIYDKIREQTFSIAFKDFSKTQTKKEMAELARKKDKK